jgi:hypothetical protein
MGRSAEPLVGDFQGAAAIDIAHDNPVVLAEKVYLEFPNTEEIRTPFARIRP